MLGWFKKKKREIVATELSKTKLQPLDYEPKIIVAWSQAISGNKRIWNWLNENGYEELAMSCYAIKLKDEARNWLQENGYAHLLAMINASEGNESAQKWLRVHKFELLYHIAMFVEADEMSVKWIAQNASSDIFLLATAIRKVKDEIEENHNDIHSFGKDL